MKCSNCGKEIKEGEKFCSNCGKAINKNIQKKNTVLTIIISIVVIIGIIIVLCIIADKQWESSGEYGLKRAEETLKDNLGVSESIKNKIIEKWQVTLPLNSTNGLEKVIYHIDTNELYLKYNLGICVVDSNDKINRYMQGDYEYGLYNYEFTNGNENKNIILMTTNEFKQIIGEE